MSVQFAILASSHIFNLTSPRYLPEISLNWGGKRPWLDPYYEPLRDIMEQIYVEEFDRANGHFQKLEESIRHEGIRNPIMVTYGGLLKRKECEVPVAYKGGYVSEWLGGSRLMIAAKLGLTVPCIINDLTDSLPYERLVCIHDIAAKFQDMPQIIQYNGRDVYINNLPFYHMNDGYNMREQVATRRSVLEKVKEGVSKWMMTCD